MKRKRLIAVAIGLLIALAALYGIRQYRRRPSPWQASVLQTVSLRIQLDGVDAKLSDELSAITVDPPVYVAKVAPGMRERTCEIVAASYKGAVGISLAAFWDQYSSSYVSAGPVQGPAGDSYMIYVAR
ncbi:MAG TPA: hypothetical protein VK191_12775 [Symbiobacteriaceae bacterium]|nr:hypothetical protein [Symbiobacteriaceae bacterium]